MFCRVEQILCCEQVNQHMVLAYNRRVDLTVNPAGQQSDHLYPFKTDDYAQLIDRNGPNKERGLEMAAEKKKIENN